MNVYDEHFESVIARIYIGEVKTTFDLMYSKSIYVSSC